MSEAACKTILCAGGARAVIQTYMIKTGADRSHAPESTDLRLAANAAVWELQTAIEVVHLLAEQNFVIDRGHAYKLIHAMDQIEANLPGATLPDAITLLRVQAVALHTGILHLHLAVTGESADYDPHG